METTTFKNKKFTKRDYEATNVVFCESEKAPDANWVPASACDFENCLAKGLTKLWIQNGIQYWGWL